MDRRKNTDEYISRHSRESKQSSCNGKNGQNLKAAPGGSEKPDSTISPSITKEELLEKTDIYLLKILQRYHIYRDHLQTYRDLKEVLDYYPENRLALRGFLETLKGLGKIELALEVLEKLRESEKNILTEQEKAVLLVEMNLPALARPVLLDLLKKGKNTPFLHSCLGRVNHELGDIENAIFHYRTALNLAPDFIEARENLATLFYEHSRFAETIDTLLSMPEKKLSGEMRWKLALSHYATGEYRKALPILERLLEEEDTILARQYIGEIYCRLEKNWKAEETWAVALKKQVTSANERLALARILLFVNETDKAEKLLILNLKEKGAQEETKFTLGLLKVSEGKLTAASSYWDELYRENPKNFRLQFNLIRNLLRRKHVDALLEKLREDGKNELRQAIEEMMGKE